VSNNLADLLRHPRRPKVLIVGDVMLDRYIWGDVDRISYEAPIPVLRAKQRENRLGGAGSVLTILGALEADSIPVWVVGDDRDGHAILDLVKKLGMPGDSILSVSGRSTTLKERFFGRTQSRHPQQMIRVDQECVDPIDRETESALLKRACEQLAHVDLVLISDYAKGVCTQGLLGKLIPEARRAGVKVIVDPGREVDYRLYAGATCITPNRTEAAMALGCTIRTPQEGLAAARRLVEAWGFDAAAVTLDRDGIAWADAKGASRIFPVRARQVYDITGAGDAVLAAMGFALALGADWPAVVQLANLAGGLEVERLGVAPVSRRDLLAEMNADGQSGTSKIISAEALGVEMDRRRAFGRKIVMTNGCFDLLHPGHVSSLQYARSLGDCLVVGLNSDASVVRLKGEGRPIIGEHGRAQMLAALACVDYVILFEETSVAPLVERVRPDILVKAAHYAPEEVVGGHIVQSYGGQIALAPVVEGLSTSEILERARRLS
jgi:D-beta-D-heptose 7-phosphate kinase/D-beta-D-heptose 1-phosphate adenosyltransferase